MAVLTFLIGYSMIKSTGGPGESIQGSFYIMVMLLLLAIVFFFSLLALCYVQTVNLIYGQTTCERFSRARFNLSQIDPIRRHNAYTSDEAERIIESINFERENLAFVNNTNT